MSRLFPPYVSQACQRYMARWCVANRGIPFGSRATRSENIRDYDKPVLEPQRHSPRKSRRLGNRHLSHPQ